MPAYTTITTCNNNYLWNNVREEHSNISGQVLAVTGPNETLSSAFFLKKSSIYTIYTAPRSSTAYSRSKSLEQILIEFGVVAHEANVDVVLHELGQVGIVATVLRRQEHPFSADSSSLKTDMLER